MFKATITILLIFFANAAFSDIIECKAGKRVFGVFLQNPWSLSLPRFILNADSFGADDENWALIIADITDTKIDAKFRGITTKEYSAVSLSGISSKERNELKLSTCSKSNNTGYFTCNTGPYEEGLHLDIEIDRISGDFKAEMSPILRLSTYEWSYGNDRPWVVRNGRKDGQKLAKEFSSGVCGVQNQTL